MKILFHCFVSFLLLGQACTSADTTTTSKTSEIDSKRETTSPQFKEDSLSIAYTYWWPASGPFIGMCGDQYSLVVTGTITALAAKQPQENFVAQRGTITLHEKIWSQATAQQKYQGEKFMVADAFAKTGVELGDKVLVFIYAYEGVYALPGGKSILKIEQFDGPEVQAIRKYIAAEQNPLVLQNDLELWAKYQLDEALQTIIDCRLSQE
ncbi:MAG: hypothetical protein AB8G15_20345 [Saprospiraceae bacterium]